MKLRHALLALGVLGIALGFLLSRGPQERGARTQEAEPAGPAATEPAAVDLAAPDTLASEQDAPARAEIAVDSRANAAAPLARPAAGEAAIDVELLSKDTGAPVPGIMLMLARDKAEHGDDDDQGGPVSHGEGPVGGLNRMVKTNTDGRVCFLAPADQAYILYVLGGQGIETTFESFLAPGDGERHSVVLRVGTDKDLVFFGRVVDEETDAPLADATIERVRNGSLTGSALTTTDGDGLFRVEGATWEPLSLRIAREGYAWRATQATLGYESAARPQLVRLPRAGSLIVRVTDALGEPAAGHEVAVETNPQFLMEDAATSGWWPGSFPSWSATTGIDGACRLLDLPPRAHFALDVKREGRLVHRWPDTIQLEPGQARELEVRLAAACTLQGVAREPDGTPTPDVDLWLAVASWPQPTKYFHPVEKGDVVATVRTNRAGEFRFEDARPGLWFVGPTPDPRGDVAALALLVTIAEGEFQKDVTLEIHRGLTVSGRLLDEDGADVVSGYVNADQIGVSADVSRGRFTLGPLAPGEVQLVGMTMSGASPTATRSEPVLANAGDTDVVLQLVKGGVLAGVALLPGGAAPELARVSLTPADADRAGFVMMGGTPTAGGAFEFTGLVPGTYHLLAREDGGFAAVVPDLTVEAGQIRRDLEVRMQPAARLRLELEPREGRHFLRVFQDDMPVAFTTSVETIAVVPGDVHVELCTFDSMSQETIVLEERVLTALAGDEREVVFAAEPPEPAEEEE